MEQLLLFQEPQEVTLSRVVKDLKEQCDKTRKGQYAKLATLTQQVKDLQTELDFLKKAICQPRQNGQFELFPIELYSKAQ